MEALGLFSWKSEVSLSTTSGSVTIHLRTLSGVQDELRTDTALAASQIAKTDLEDKKSVLYKNHIAPLLGLHREGLLEVVRQLQRGLFVRMAQWKVESFGEPDAPEEALSGTDIIKRPDLGDVMDWMDKKDSTRGELEKRRTEWVIKQMEVLEKELKKLKIRQLRDRTVELHKGAIMDRAYNREWDYQTVLMGSFKGENCTKPFFGTIQEVRGLPRPTFLQIAAAYRELDTFSYNPELLKNS